MSVTSVIKWRDVRLILYRRAGHSLIPSLSKILMHKICKMLKIRKRSYDTFTVVIYWCSSKLFNASIWVQTIQNYNDILLLWSLQVAKGVSRLFREADGFNLRNWCYNKPYNTNKGILQDLGREASSIFKIF